MSSKNSPIQKAIEYIEKNLHETLSLNEIAKVASYSPFHFSRIFKQETGENINSMIKRLRLAQSTHYLMYRNSLITEIGLDVGYETPSSFNKAFKQIFNMSPREYKLETENNLKKYIKKLKTEPIIIDFKEDIYTYFDRSLGEYNDAAISAWNKLITQIELNKVELEFSDKRYFGLCFDNPKITEYEKMRYEACISVNKDEQNQINLKKIKILPKGKYAKLKFCGDYEDLYDVWFQFYGWIYKKQLELDNFPPIEEYLDSPKDILNGNTLVNTTNLLLKINSNCNGILN
ncbi:GyrI-like domain-containing protein [Sulfurospirillum sp. 1307]|jgi:AraC family transcriptional regulator